MLRSILFATSVALITATALAQQRPTADELARKLTPVATRSLNDPCAARARSIVIEASHVDEVIDAKKCLPKVDIKIGFEFNSAALTPDGRGTVKVLADALAQPALQSQKFLVGGHTDAVGSDEYNQGLSEARARTVADELVRTYHIAPDRLKTIGFGKRELADKQHPESGENRRVEVVTLP